MRCRVATTVLGLFLVLIGPGCTSLSPLEEVTSSGGCATDLDCKGERVCHENACVFPDSLFDGGLTPPLDGGLPIDGGTATDGGTDGGSTRGPPPGTLGAACEFFGDCTDPPGAFCATDPNLPGGYCVMLDCSTCPDTGSCVEIDGMPLCMQRCNFDRECREGYYCSLALGEPTCLPGAGGEGNQGLGESCNAAADCAEVASVCVADFPGGYCATTDCLRCPDNGVCVKTPEGEACMLACDPDRGCTRDGYVCKDTFGAPTCLPDGGDTPVGGACTADVECAGLPAVCIRQWPQGYCAQTACPCPADSVCTIRPNGEEVCLAGCTVDEDCRANYQCSRTSTGSVCIPR